MSLEQNLSDEQRERSFEKKQQAYISKVIDNKGSGVTDSASNLQYGLAAVAALALVLLVYQLYRKNQKAKAR